MVDQIQIGFLALLVGFSALFSGSEIAFVSISEIKTKTLQGQKLRGADSLFRLKQKPKRLLITILIINNLLNIGAAGLATVMATNAFGSTGIGISTGVMTLVILIFGEVTPKSYATTHNVRVSLLMARPLEVLGYILLPLVIPLEKLSNFITRSDGKNENPKVTEAELKTMLDVGEEERVIEKHEKEFMKGVLKSGEITAREVMTPRLKMFVIESDISIREAIDELTRSKFSRAPIIEGSRDKIIGLVHLKDLLMANLHGDGKEWVMKVARSPLFVSQKEIVGDLFSELQSKRAHIAIVVDEFGGVEGLLTLEDLLEEIVGEITDEGEISPMQIRRIDKNSVFVHGDTEIDTIDDFCNISLPREDDISTINGLLHHLLKDLPKVGDRVDLENVSLVVEETRENTPFRIRLTMKTGSQDGSDTKKKV